MSEGGFPFFPRWTPKFPLWPRVAGELIDKVPPISGPVLKHSQVKECFFKAAEKLSKLVKTKGCIRSGQKLWYAIKLLRALRAGGDLGEGIDDLPGGLSEAPRDD